MHTTVKPRLDGKTSRKGEYLLPGATSCGSTIRNIQAGADAVGRVFQDTLAKDEVPADVWLTINMGISSYLNVPPPTSHPTPCATALEHAYHRQTKSGWKNFMKGRISSAWGDWMMWIGIPLARASRRSSNRKSARRKICQIHDRYVHTSRQKHASPPD